jgi:hypothetical protein
MKNFTLLLTSAAIILASCAEEPLEIEKPIELKKITLTAEDSIPVEPTRIKGIGHTGDYAFRTDSLNQYSAGIVEMLPDSLINSRIRVCVDFWVKSSNPLKGDGLAISYNLKETMMFWKTFDPINYGAKANEWINIKDSVTFNADQFKEPGVFIKLFGFNANQKANMDLDDINVSIKKIYTVLQD